MTRRLRAGREGDGGIEDAPADGTPYVRQNGMWVPENVFGTEWQATPEVVTPLVLNATFAPYVTMTTTNLAGGVYEVAPFIAATGDSANGQWEARIVVDGIPFGVALFETFGTAGAIKPLTALIPLPFGPGVHTIVTEARQPGGPGAVSAVRGATILKRAI
jgi:hypothetical protein